MIYSNLLVNCNILNYQKRKGDVLKITKNQKANCWVILSKLQMVTPDANSAMVERPISKPK